MLDNTVTRNQSGQTNARDTELFSDLPVQDESKLHIYLDDFDYYSGPVAAGTTNGYTLTGVGATVTMAAADGGAVNLNALTTGFIAALQRSQGNFQLAKGFRSWYEALLNLSSLANSAQLIAGLTNVTGTPFTGGSITDGVWFSSDASGNGVLSINVAVGGVVSTTAIGANLVAGQLARLAWYYDGAVYASAPLGRVLWEATGPGVTAAVRGEVLVPAAGTIAAFPGATLLAPQTAVKATAGATALLIDLLNAMKDRTNINATPVF